MPGSTSKDVFVKHPEKLSTEIVVRDERNLIAYHYRVQDTPGRPALRPPLNSEVYVVSMSVCVMICVSCLKPMLATCSGT